MALRIVSLQAYYLQLQMISSHSDVATSRNTVEIMDLGLDRLSLFEPSRNDRSILLTNPALALSLTQRLHPGRRALLHNLATDETLMTFSNASGAGTTSELYSNSANPTPAAGGACTTISFRTGASTKLHVTLCKFYATSLRTGNFFLPFSPPPPSCRAGIPVRVSRVMTFYSGTFADAPLRVAHCIEGCITYRTHGINGCDCADSKGP